MNPILKNDNTYLEVNKELWENKVDHHVQSDFYANDDFLKGKSSLKSIELNLLGDITGKRILHLQCHFGQDSLSLARMGAKVTGIDFSEKAIAKAQEMNTELGLDAEFHCTNVYDVPTLDLAPFDIVFTSYGTIGWLPDINRWATTIASQLKVGGKLVFVEFHPFIWMYDNDFKDIAYSYFNVSPIVEETEGTYAQKDAPIKNASISWNHAMSEVVTALLKAGMEMTALDEFAFSPYDCFQEMTKVDEDVYIINRFGNKAPLVYAISANKKG